MKSTREVTIYDIAKALNLSPSTVSRALNDHPHISDVTKSMVLTMAEELGYQRNKFASNLRQKRTNTIGVIVPRLDSYFMATAIAGIEKVTSLHGYGLIISQSQESWKKEISCVSTMYNSRVDGLLVSLALDTRDTEHFNMMISKDIPVIFFDRAIDSFGSVSVVIDNFRAGYEATAHLIEQGCRRIVHAGGNLLRNVYNERLKGYMKALADNKIDFDPELTFITDMSGKSGTETAVKILNMEQLPDGIFAANDTSAVAMMVELIRNGIKIPGQIAVAGFNNEPLCKVVQPNLTSIDYPAGEIGETAAISLLNKLKSSESSEQSLVVLNHSLIVRESSIIGRATDFN